MLTIGSLFSGIGGLELGLEWAGVGRTVWQVEIDPFCRRVLEQHWPEAQRYEDVQTFGGAPADLICGGFPCQDLSHAGKRAGLDGKRSGLWREFARIVGAVRPTWVVVENVFHAWRSWVPFVRSDLHGLGYASVPLCLRASDVGAPYARARVFVVAHADGDLLRLGGQRFRQREHQHPQQAFASDDGAQRLAADAYDQGQLQPERSEQEQRRRARDGTWWDAEPDMARVVPRLQRGVDGALRERALGNCVVPPVALVVGDCIREMMASSGE